MLSNRVPSSSRPSQERSASASDRAAPIGAGIRLRLSAPPSPDGCSLTRDVVFEQRFSRARARARVRLATIVVVRSLSRAMGDRRPLSPGFRGTCRQTRDGGGLPETEEGEEGCIPPGITHDLVLQFDLPARKAEREERLLAFNGGNVNATLWDICEEGGGKDTRFLLAHGAGANHVGVDGWRVIWRASRNGHLGVVEALLDAGADGLGEALYDAANDGHTAAVALLLDRGVDIHSANDFALYCAALYGHLATATLLLQRGATAQDYILADVVRFGRHAIADLLRAHGAV